MVMAMISIRQLAVKKQDREICYLPDLRVAEGSRIALVGANGSGKSTLLRVIAGLECDFQGTCEVAANHRNRGYVHQTPYLFRGTVEDNLVYGGKVRGWSQQLLSERCHDWMERFKIQEFARSSALQLSGGERRRVALARAMILEPQLLLLDEPLADLDDQAMEWVAEACRQLADTTIVMASPLSPPGTMGFDELSMLSAREARAKERTAS